MDEDALVRAATHMGEHIADIRKPPTAETLNTLFDMEYQGWATTVLDAVGLRQRTLTLPGGYVIWNSSWPAADQQSSLDHAISDYILKVEFLTR
jgi:hypothetical protein